MRLVRSLVSSWQRDPLARGAYIDTGRSDDNDSRGSESDSACDKGTNADDDEDEREAWRFVRLCEPVDSQPPSNGAAATVGLGRSQLVSHPRVWFAGDAYNAPYMGSYAFLVFLFCSHLLFNSC